MNEQEEVRKANAKKMDRLMYNIGQLIATGILFSILAAVMRLLYWIVSP